MAMRYWQYRDPAEPALLARVWPDGLLAHVRAIASWPRESGSRGEARAFAYIERALKEYGLEIDRREVDALISLPESACLVLPDGSAVEALTHSFAASADGLEAPVVDVGEGHPEDWARADARGKIALVASFATPGKVWAAEQAGAVGQIFVNVDHLHNMIVTTVWGTPAPETAWRIPRTPSLSIRRADGDRLRALLAAGRRNARLVTRVRTGWVSIPHLVGHLEAPADDRFVLFSGHVDAWHHGAMDNASANATMLEVARLLAGHRDRLRRGMRFAFWSGHSHGRYAGSAWYADHAWRDLHRRCVLHLNVDSTGARGATEYSVLHATEEAMGFAETVVRDVTGQPGRGHRMPRAGDQSFWGIGVPSAFMSLSGLPAQDTEFGRATLRLFGTAGYPWWWHTTEDTVDKIDADVLALDTRVYLAAALRLCGAPILPLEYGRLARALLTTCRELAALAGDGVDLGPATAAARLLVERTDVLAAALDTLASARPAPKGAEVANRALMRLSRVLIPLAYTTGDRFAHDLALPVPPLAGLQGARELPALDRRSDAFKLVAASLVREQNRVVHALEAAATIIEDTLARKEIAP